MQHAAEAIRMEALRRWCHYFVTSHPVRNWPTRALDPDQIPGMPVEFNIVTGNALGADGASFIGPIQHVGPRGRDTSDVHGVRLPARSITQIEAALQTRDPAPRLSDDQVREANARARAGDTVGEALASDDLTSTSAHNGGRSGSCNEYVFYSWSNWTG